MIDRVFRGPQAARLAGITYRQLDYWARTGMARPSVSQAAGCGSVRRYSYRDVFDLYLIARLANQGVSIQRCRDILDVVRAADDPYSKILVIAAEVLLVPHNAAALVDVLDGSAVSLVVSLPTVEHDLDARLLTAAQVGDVDYLSVGA